jgi:hypothetical protein
VAINFSEYVDVTGVGVWVSNGSATFQKDCPDALSFLQGTTACFLINTNSLLYDPSAQVQGNHIEIYVFNQGAA